MWDWLKKKKTPALSTEAEALLVQWVGPQALAGAIAETVRNYVGDVQAGRKKYPAHRRKPVSVVELWRDLRMEALHKLFNFGQSNPFLLSEQTRQAELLGSFLDERPHLEMPQPRGEPVADTLQAMWQVYVYLSEVGSEVADRETDRGTLRLAKRSILDSITARAEALRPQWEAYARDPVPKMPTTLIEALYEDVTAKAKSIALTTVFGPSYEAGIEHVVKLAADRGTNVDEFRTSIRRVMAATDPDKL